MSRWQLNGSMAARAWLVAGLAVAALSGCGKQDTASAGEATGTEPARRPMDRQPPAISREEIEQARKGKGHTQNDSIKRSS